MIIPDGSPREEITDRLVQVAKEGSSLPWFYCAAPAEKVVYCTWRVHDVKYAFTHCSSFVAWQVGLKLVYHSGQQR